MSISFLKLRAIYNFMFRLLWWLSIGAGLYFIIEKLWILLVADIILAFIISGIAPGMYPEKGYKELASGHIDNVQGENEELSTEESLILSKTMIKLGFLCFIYSFFITFYFKLNIFYKIFLPIASWPFTVIFWLIPIVSLLPSAWRKRKMRNEEK